MLATSKWFNLFFQFIRERIDLEALMLLSEADLGEVGFDFSWARMVTIMIIMIVTKDVGDADNKNDNYYDNSDYYQRCWGCRWAPGKSCWKQLRREGDNFVKRLQQSSRTFLSLRTFSSSLWYSSLKSFTITWILECSNRLLEEKVYYIMVISAHSANWHVFLMWQNWHLCKSHFPHQVLILMFSILSDFFPACFLY